MAVEKLSYCFEDRWARKTVQISSFGFQKIQSIISGTEERGQTRTTE